MNREIANAIAGTTLASARGMYFRHAWHGVKELKGSTAGGRWGPEHGFPVVYLGQPLPSVVAEAYRRLVDPVEGMRGDLVGPRVLLSVEVDVDQLLDLRDPQHLSAVGLDEDALRGPWAPCVRVGRAAHQLGLHGVLAPAATDLGLTLALFEHHLPHSQTPRIIHRHSWTELPPDPRSPAQRQAQIARNGCWEPDAIRIAHLGGNSAAARSASPRETTRRRPIYNVTRCPAALTGFTSLSCAARYAHPADALGWVASRAEDVP